MFSNKQRNQISFYAFQRKVVRGYNQHVALYFGSHTFGLLILSNKKSVIVRVISLTLRDLPVY